MRLKTLEARDPGQNSFMTHGYSYSPAGNLTGKETEHGAYSYQYDTLYRLTAATNPALPGESYSYDALGNRLTDERVNGQWAYSGNSELTAYGDVTFAYDENGNMIRKTAGGLTRHLIYDVENRLRVERDGQGRAGRS